MRSTDRSKKRIFDLIAPHSSTGFKNRLAMRKIKQTHSGLIEEEDCNEVLVDRNTLAQFGGSRSMIESSTNMDHDLRRSSSQIQDLNASNRK